MISIGTGEPTCLTVVIHGQPVGTIAVTYKDDRKVFGRFTPNNNFEPYRNVFEAAVNLAHEYDCSIGCGVCDGALWDRLMESYSAINQLGPVLKEWPYPIEEFSVEADWSVEITFYP